MNIRVKFLGGAQTVTGSKYLLEIDDLSIMVDCGMFQGLKKLRLRNWDPLPIKPADVDYIILTHAHIDHSGYLPKMYKDGFEGEIYCSEATSELTTILLRDSAKLQQEEADFAKKKGYSKHENPLALYSIKDVEETLDLIRPFPFDKRIKITEKIEVEFSNGGHILGASIVTIYVKTSQGTKKIVFSGDLGKIEDPILHPPKVIEEADILFLESTYGNRNPENDNVEDKIQQIINEKVYNNGCLIIPAFAVGRTQLILYYIVELMKAGKIPKMPIYIDSPMAINVTFLYKEMREYHKLTLNFFNDCIFDYDKIRYVVDSAESKQLNEKKKNCIIISASGMCTGGRILHHIYHRLPNKNDTILFVGFQAIETRGDRILKGEPTIKIFGEEVKVNAQIETISSLSAHANARELFNWAKNIKEKPKKTFVIHGEKESSDALANKIRSELKWNVYVPDYLESFILYDNI